jgi:hypothetical protein
MGADLPKPDAAAMMSQPGNPIYVRGFGGTTVQVGSQAEYASGIAAVPFSGGSADQFAASVASEAARLGSGFAFLFHSLSAFDTSTLAAALSRHAPELRHAGCTSAGELLPSGISDGEALAILLPRERFTIVSAMIGNIRSTSMDDIAATVERLKRELADRTADRPGLGRFALCLIDGMSFAEEAVTAAFHWALDDIPLIGGSAGDDLRFETTTLLHNGHVASNSAVILLAATDLPFQVFKTDNFEPTGEKLVVTASDPDRRIVHEFNAGKAAEEFASAVGILPDQLTPMSFASHPVVVRVGGEYYCRSIQKVNADGSLSFFCAIDDGIVLSIAQPRGMVESTRSALRDIRERLGGIDVVLGFDCVLRRLDARNRQLFRDMSELYRANNVIGFGTYGEQYRSMHLNQTLTGIAFGSRAVGQ